MKIGILTAIAVMIVSLTIGGWFVKSSLGEDVFAVKVNGEIITEAEVEAAVDQTTRQVAVLEIVNPEAVDSISTDQGAVVENLIASELELQYAHKKGFKCSKDEAVEFFRGQDGLRVEDVVIVAAQSGLVSIEYLSLPESERTPSSSEVYNSYFDDSKIVKQLVAGCELSKLYETLGDPGEDDVLSIEERNTGINEMRKSIRESAKIERKEGY